MARPRGVRISGPLGVLRDDVEESLRRQRYSPSRTAVLLLLVAHLSRWLEEHGLTAGDLTSERVEQFFSTFRASHRWCRTPRSLAPVLEHLRAAGVVPDEADGAPPPSPEDELVVRFERYLRDRRGLSETTIHAYAKYARVCLRAWWPEGEITPSELGAADVVAVVGGGAVCASVGSTRW